MKLRINNFIIILTLTILVATAHVSWGGTALGDLAASMQPGEWTEFTNGRSGLDILGATGRPYSILDQLSNRGAWDSVLSWASNMAWDHISGNQQERARKYSRNLWLNNEWKKAIRPFNSIIEKLAPVPTWENVEA